VQSRRAAEHPQATAFFTWHVNFYGFGGHQWSAGPAESELECQVIAPASFLERYNSSTGTFYSMSFCCIPRWLLAQLPGPPFWEAVSGVDDCYLGNLLPLRGAVVFTPAQLVAYRVTAQAQSTNHLKNFHKVVQVFESLETLYRDAGNAALWRAFQLAFAGKRRRYGKTLMGAGRRAEARHQFRRAVTQSPNPLSMAKSASLLFLSLLPAPMQPRWPAGSRPHQQPAQTT
jgi:hypothetical protein